VAHLRLLPRAASAATRPVARLPATARSDGTAVAVALLLLQAHGSYRECVFLTF
jgi:hypothetical protein